MKEIKEKGLFATTHRLQLERRASMPQDISSLFCHNLLAGSRLSTPGTYIDDHNRVAQLRHADPSVHRHASKPVKPLTVATIDAQELDEPEQEVEQPEDDMTELMPVTPTVEAGFEEPRADTDLDDNSSLDEPQEADELGEAEVSHE